MVCVISSRSIDDDDDDLWNNETRINIPMVEEHSIGQRPREALSVECLERNY